jgi:hypothetical protein
MLAAGLHPSGRERERESSQEQAVVLVYSCFTVQHNRYTPLTTLLHHIGPTILFVVTPPPPPSLRSFSFISFISFIQLDEQDEVDLYGDLGGDDAGSDQGGGDADVDLYSDLVSPAAPNSAKASVSLVESATVLVSPPATIKLEAEAALSAPAPIKLSHMKAPGSKPQPIDPLATDPILASMRVPGVHSLYVGGFQWYTTDQQVVDFCTKTGVTDLKRVVIYMNQQNGKSKCFGMVSVGSNESKNKLIAELPKLEMPEMQIKK